MIPLLNAYFISDIHIRDPQEPNAQMLLGFLNSLENPTHLFLLGDIFDLWIHNHAFFVKRHEAIIDALRAVAERGVEIHYFEGNHDLYLHSFWSGQLGFHVHSSPITANLGPYRVRVEHGDEIDRDDRGYLFLRWLLRTRAVGLLARHLPGVIVTRIGTSASQASRHYTSEVKTIQRDRAISKVRGHAFSVAEKDVLDFVITGHLHVRDDFSFAVGKRNIRSVNLGTWLDKPCAFHLTESFGKFIEL